MTIFSVLFKLVLKFLLYEDITGIGSQASVFARAGNEGNAHNRGPEFYNIDMRMGGLLSVKRTRTRETVPEKPPCGLNGDTPG